MKIWHCVPLSVALFGLRPSLAIAAQNAQPPRRARVEIRACGQAEVLIQAYREKLIHELMESGFEIETLPDAQVDADVLVDLPCSEEPDYVAITRTTSRTETYSQTIVLEDVSPELRPETFALAASSIVEEAQRPHRSTGPVLPASKVFPEARVPAEPTGANAKAKPAPAPPDAKPLPSSDGETTPLPAWIRALDLAIGVRIFPERSAPVSFFQISGPRAFYSPSLCFGYSESKFSRFTLWQQHFGLAIYPEIWAARIPNSKVRVAALASLGFGFTELIQQSITGERATSGLNPTLRMDAVVRIDLPDREQDDGPRFFAQGSSGYTVGRAQRISPETSESIGLAGLAFGADVGMSF